MKVCVISTGVFAVPLSGYGGLEIIAWQVAKGLSAKGHEVALIAPEGSSCPNVTIIPIGPPGTWDEKKSYSTYWQHLNNFDVVIDHTWNKWSYQLKIEGRLKAPILGVCHAPIHTMYQELPPVEKPCFVCISDDQRSHFEGLFGRPARTAYNGIDLDHYKPISIPRNNRYLFLARFSTIKGPDLSQDLALATNSELDMIGDTAITGEPALLEQCKKRADGKQIKLIGGISRGETVYWYSKARALWHLNQRFREPFGLAPVEAMACGLPVLCWNNGAMRETVVHGETGFIINSMQEAEEVVRSGALDKIDRNKCIERAATFSIERMTSRYEELCFQALNTGGW